MKKNYYICGALALALICTLPGIAKAEESTIGGSAEINTQTSTQTPANIREKLRLEYEVKMKNMKANQGIRNETLEQRKVASTTSGSKPIINTIRKDIRSDERADIKIIRTDTRIDIRNASTSQDRKEIRRDMHVEMFQVHKNTLVLQLNLALSNLKQIKGRIVSHLEKIEVSGRPMTEARALLVTFDTKVTTAEMAISSLTAFTPSVTVTSTTTVAGSVNLDKPRQIGETAIKAVKEAHEALSAVVRSINKNNVKGTVSATTTVSASPTTITP